MLLLFSFLPPLFPLPPPPPQSAPTNHELSAPAFELDRLGSMGPFKNYVTARGGVSESVTECYVGEGGGCLGVRYVTEQILVKTIISLKNVKSRPQKR